MTLKIVKKRESVDALLSHVVGLYYLLDTFQIAVKNAYGIVGAGREVINRGIIAVMALSLLFALGTILKRNLRKVLTWELIFILLYAKSILYDGVDVSFLSGTMLWTLGACIPLGICASSVKDKRVLLNILKKYGYWQTGLLWWLMITRPLGDGAYDMSTGYALLIPSLIFYTVFFQEKHLRYLVIALLSTMSIFAYGSRGPLLGIAVFFLVNIFLHSARTKKGFAIKASGVICILVAFLYRNSLIMFLADFFTSHGISSRTMSALVSGTIASSKGREILFGYYWREILKRPFGGWGLQGGWIGPGSGPHNMILEILLAFGIPAGLVLTVILILLFIKVSFSKRSPDRDVAFVFACAMFSMFLVDGDCLEKPKLFLFIMLAASLPGKLLHMRHEGMRKADG